MGLAYKVEDLQLNCPAPRKFLPEELAQDFLTLRRFEREARNAQSLNHLLGIILVCCLLPSWRWCSRGLTMRFESATCKRDLLS